MLAAAMTPDRYSAAAVVNKGLYNQNYASTANADQFTLRKPGAAKPALPSAASCPSGGCTASPSGHPACGWGSRSRQCRASHRQCGHQQQRSRGQATF